MGLVLVVGACLTGCFFSSREGKNSSSESQDTEFKGPNINEIYQLRKQENQQESSQVQILPMGYNRDDNYSFEKECRYQVSVKSLPTEAPTLKIRMHPENEATILFSKDVGLENKKSVSFAIPIQTLDPGAYVIEAKASGEDGKTIAETRRRFHKNRSIPGEVTFRDDKTILADGEPFFPFGFYAADELGKLELMAANGFNAALYAGSVYSNPERMNRYLSAVYAFDAKALPRAYDKNMHVSKKTSPEAARLIAERITALKSNPAILSWYIADEPDGNRIPFLEIDRLANFIRNYDVNHPICLVTLRADVNPYAQASDIQMNDPYYPMWRPNIATVRAYMDQGIRSADGKKPYIAVLLGAFHDSKGKDIRCQAYLAIVRGAKGVMFFSMQYVLNHEALWEEFKRVGREIDDISPVIFAPDASEPIEVTSDLIPPDILLKKYNGTYYLIAVNYQRAEITATFDLSALSVNKTIDRVYEDRTISLENSRFTDTFKGYDVHIYRIQPKVEKPPDTQSIEIINLRPRDGDRLTLASPLIRASFIEGEAGPNLDPDSVEVMVDGKRVESSDGLVLNLKGIKKGIHYIPNEDLPQGLHTIHVNAKDYLGSLVSRSWSFTTTNYPVPFVDHFDLPNPAWSPESGKWEIRDGSYFADSQGDKEALSFVHDINLRGNYRIEFSAKINRFKDDSQIMLYLNENLRPYLFKIWFTQSKAYLARISDTPHADGNIGPLQKGIWHRFRVVRKERDITCFVDDKPAFSFHVPWSGNGGGFAIGAKNAKAAFRDLTIKRLVDK